MQDKKTFPSLSIQNQKQGSWVYFWIAHYNDGTSLPQYDPYTLDKHVFDEVEKDRLVKFGWYPFPITLADRLMKEKKLNIKCNPFLPKYEVEIDDNKRVIGALTTNFIENASYIICPKCGSKFKDDKIKRINIGANKSQYICPKCGEKPYWKCSSCGMKYDHLKDTDNYHCTKCGHKVGTYWPKFSIMSEQRRWRIYKLGYQETVNGINKKTIMHIQENGDVELKDN